MKTQTVERFDISLKTPVGQLSTMVEVPTGFVPITAIVPLMRRLGDEAMALEEQQARETGLQISCRKGCAACCRMLVPVSAPEAFALKQYVLSLSEDRRHILSQRIADAVARLQHAGLLDRLAALGESQHQLSDEDLEPINRDYYALRIPCPFLDNEMCSIYEHRPSACRELLVTTPAELCQDLANNPVRPLPVSIRMTTVLGLLWSALTKKPGILIPLPLALQWSDRHEDKSKGTWTGIDLLEKALEKAGRFLGQESAQRNDEVREDHR